MVSNVLSSFRSQAPAATVFAGSPQLLGAVKLGSGSAVTSLPIYSDINLLKRTEDVSEMNDSLENTVNLNKLESSYLPVINM